MVGKCPGTVWGGVLGHPGRPDLIYVQFLINYTQYPRDKLDAEYDRAKVPQHNGNDPSPAPGSLKALLFPPLLNKVQNKGTQGVQARYGVELPPFISIVQCPGRPVILGVDERDISMGQPAHVHWEVLKGTCPKGTLEFC